MIRCCIAAAVAHPTATAFAGGAAVTVIDCLCTWTGHRVAHLGPLFWFSPKSNQKMADESFGRGFRSPKSFRAPRGRVNLGPISINRNSNQITQSTAAMNYRYPHMLRLQLASRTCLLHPDHLRVHAMDRAERLGLYASGLAHGLSTAEVRTWAGAQPRAYKAVRTTVYVSPTK